MRLTRYTHACVRLDVDGVVLVIDPGEFGTIPDLAEADAVLVTHDHFDHLSHDALRAAVERHPGLLVVGPQPIADGIDVPVRVVDGGDAFDVRGVDVRVVGHVQAVTDLRDEAIPNVGYLVGGVVLHPGDALHDIDVDVLLLPMEVPWADNVDRQLSLRRHPPKRLVPIHDGTLNDTGVEFSGHTAQHLADDVGAQALLLRDGDSVEL